MKRILLWLTVPAVTCLAACYNPEVVAVVQLPAEMPGAQSPAPAAIPQPPSDLTLTVEVFCSQTKLRTANARIRWTLQPTAMTARGITNLANAKQTLEFSVFDQGLEKGLFATLPIAVPAGDRQTAALTQPITALAQGRAPTLRAYQVRLIEIERPAARVGADVAGEMSVVIEDVEPGMNYTWRVALEGPTGRLVSAPITLQAPTCPADFIRR